MKWYLPVFLLAFSCSQACAKMEADQSATSEAAANKRISHLEQTLDSLQQGNKALKREVLSLKKKVGHLEKDNQELEETIAELNESDVNKDPQSSNWQLVLVGLFTGIGLFYFIPFIRRRMERENNQVNLAERGSKNKPIQAASASEKPASPSPPSTAEETEIGKPKLPEISLKGVVSASLNANSTDNWLVAHASTIGKSHRMANPPIPCQDNHAVLSLEQGWGIAISCDGAGSAKLSHEGSNFVSKEAAELFHSIISKNNWIRSGQLPNNEGWEKVSLQALKKLRYDLEIYAKAKELNIADLACTIIVVIYSPHGLLMTHIGDGRAGYRTVAGDWKAILEPHKGEEANQTIFLTSNPWLSENFMMSGVRVPESRVIRDRATAFTLMSDGCESHSFELGYFDKEEQKFIEQNKPFPRFFEPLLLTLKGMKKEGLSEEEILEKWARFVADGSENLSNEPDDKTLILGVTID